LVRLATKMLAQSLENPTLIAVGTAACSIVGEILGSLKGVDVFFINNHPPPVKSTMITNFISVDSTFSEKIREEVYFGMEGILRKIGRRKLSIIVTGLGGVFGSSASPLIAMGLKESGSKVVSFAVMPLKCETWKHFKAAVSLRKLERASDITVIIDNDGFFKNPPMPLVKKLRFVNSLIGRTILEILRSVRDGMLKVDLGDLIFATGGTRSILFPGEEFTELARNVLSAGNPTNVVLYVLCREDVTSEDIEELVKSLNYALGGEVVKGISVRLGGREELVAISTYAFPDKFAKYDPLGEFLASRELDLEPDEGIPIEGSLLRGLKSI